MDQKTLAALFESYREHRSPEERAMHLVFDKRGRRGRTAIQILKNRLNRKEGQEK